MKLIIFSGTYAEAVRWAQNHGLGPYGFVWANEARHIRGYRFAPAVVVGTFWQRRTHVVIELMEAAKCQGFHWIEAE